MSAQSTPEPRSLGTVIGAIEDPRDIVQIDPDSGQLAFFLYALQKQFGILLQLAEKLFGGLLRIRLDRCAGQASSFPVDITELGIGAAYIYSQYNLQFRHWQCSF